jgi:hypothetical protein
MRLLVAAQPNLLLQPENVVLTDIILEHLQTNWLGDCLPYSALLRLPGLA